MSFYIIVQVVTYKMTKHCAGFMVFSKSLPSSPDDFLLCFLEFMDGIISGIKCLQGLLTRVYATIFDGFHNSLLFYLKIHKPRWPRLLL